jgi:hypothetical protein
MSLNREPIITQLTSSKAPRLPRWLGHGSTATSRPPRKRDRFEQFFRRQLGTRPNVIPSDAPSRTVSPNAVTTPLITADECNDTPAKAPSPLPQAPTTFTDALCSVSPSQSAFHLVRQAPQVPLHMSQIHQTPFQSQPRTRTTEIRRSFQPHFRLNSMTTQSTRKSPVRSP